MYNIFELNEKSLNDLKFIATELGIDDENMDRGQLIYEILDHQVDHPDIKKTEKPKKQKTKAEKPEPKKPELNKTAEKPASKEPEAEPVKEPVIPALEEPKAEAQSKRTKRPRISKSA